MDDTGDTGDTDDMGGLHDSELAQSDHVPTPVDQLPRLPARVSSFAPPPAAPEVGPPIDAMVSVVVPTPPTKRRRGLFAGLAAVVVLIAVTAASFAWKPDDPSPSFSLTSAAAATQQIDALRFEMEADVGDTNVAVKGLMDVPARVAQMDLDGSSIPGAPAGSTVTTFVDMKNLVMYISGDVFGLPLPEGKTWIQMDLRQLAETMGADLSTLTQNSTNDPLSAAALAADATTTTDLGSEVILDGVTAQHFQFEVAIDDALLAAGTTREKVAGGSGATLPDVVVYDAWVDEDNYIRQMEFNVSIGDQQVHYAVRYTEINPAVTVALPTEDESVDIFDLAGA